MLPGLRFLFAAIVLSTSLLIFGLGAAALLRAAHQEFASLPSRPKPPEPIFASQSDGTIPSLAMMRVDDLAADQVKLDRPATDNIQAPPAPESSPSIVAAPTEAPAAELDSVALPVAPEPELQNVAEVPPSETPSLKEPAAVSDTPPAAELQPAAEAPPIVETPSSTETKLATTETVTPPSPNQAAPADPELASAAIATTDAASSEIATLGGPPVEIETQAPPIKARQKSTYRAEKKRQRAERESKRRKMARHARALRRASRAPADPFGAASPFGGFPGASRTQ